MTDEDKDKEYWYRFVDREVSTIVDAERELYGSELEVSLQAYLVLQYTPQGVWLHSHGFDNRRWCKLKAHKRFACPTVEEAFESFKARKEKQIRIYTQKVSRSKQAIRLAAKKARVTLPEDEELQLLLT